MGFRRRVQVSKQFGTSLGNPELPHLAGAVTCVFKS